MQATTLSPKLKKIPDIISSTKMGTSRTSSQRSSQIGAHSSFSRYPRNRESHKGNFERRSLFLIVEIRKGCWLSASNLSIRRLLL
ncbi:hypothetical protein O181_007696 [Austropuccinia psidii MF-1]|uniref:Uncharacterized protein n=1 Tax=Austropuccinia psidii MF-1 TaxID=1389203 RepID=A0A9Q3GHU5_9BASI|nr:hypothetical protein [Austropuccinia psidii MF-1]